MGEILGFLLLAGFFGGLPGTVAYIRLKHGEKLAAIAPVSIGTVFTALLCLMWVTA